MGSRKILGSYLELLIITLMVFLAANVLAEASIPMLQNSNMKLVLLFSGLSFAFSFISMLMLFYFYKVKIKLFNKNFKILEEIKKKSTVEILENNVFYYNEILKNVFYSFGDMLIVYDSSCNLVAFNTHFNTFINKYNKTVPETKLCDLLNNLELSCEEKKDTCIVKKVINNNEKIDFDKKLNGSIYNVSVNPVFRNKKRINNVIVHFRDVSNKYNNFEEKDNIINSLKKVNSDIKKEMTSIVKKDKIKNEFFAIAAHDIKTPLSAIYTFSDFLITKSKVNNEEKDILKFINTCSTKLIRMLEDYIKAISVDTIELKVNYSVFDIKEIIDEIHNLFSYRFKGKNIHFYNNINVLTKIKTDREKIFQVLLNLVDNALKYTEKGFVKISVELKNNDIVFEIMDTGIGISESEIENIFNIFKRTEQGIEKALGTGVGLATTKKIIDLLGGCIQVESEIDKFTKITFKVPNVKHKAAEPEAHRTNNIVKRNIESDIKISYSEEDLGFNKLLEKFLKKFSASKINSFTTNRALLDDFKKKNGSYDLVLLDTQIPDLDTQELIDEILNINENVLIIAIGDFSSEEVRQKYLDMGCSDYFSKPIKYKELCARLKELLNINVNIKEELF